MPFDPSKPFTVESADIHQGSSGFDPSKPFTSVDTQAPQQSAQKAFESGASNATFTPDTGPNAGKEMLPSGHQRHEILMAGASGLATAGSMVGGTIGETGGPLGSIAGAALGAGLGAKAYNTLNEKLGQGEENKNVNQEALIGGASQALALGVSAALPAAGQALKNWAQDVKLSTIPALKQYVKRLGGEAGVTRLANLLEDEGVTNVPTIAKRLETKLVQATSKAGQGLSQTATQIDRVAEYVQPGPIAATRAYDQWVEAFPQFNKGALPDEATKRIAKTQLNNALSDQGVLSFAQTNKQATQLEQSLYNHPTLSKRGSLIQSLGAAIRESASKEALSSGTSPELIQSYRQLSSDYSKLAFAKTALNKSAPIEVLKNLGIRTGIGASVGGAVGGAVGGIEGAKRGAQLGSFAGLAASSTLGKLAIGSAAQYPGQVIATLGKMSDNAVARSILNMIAKKGFDAGLERFGHAMLDDPKFHDLYQTQLDMTTDQTSGQPTSNQPATQ